MNLPTGKVILFILTIFLIPACSVNEGHINNSQQNIDDLNTPSSSSELRLKSDFIIYDYNPEGAGLEQVSIRLSNKTGDNKKDIVTAFLEHNHFLNQANQISLSHIEEIGNQTNFHLTTIKDLENPNNLQFFKKALELTLLRYLKNNDFKIIIG